MTEAPEDSSCLSAASHTSHVRSLSAVSSGSVNHKPSRIVSLFMWGRRNSRASWRARVLFPEPGAPLIRMSKGLRTTLPPNDELIVDLVLGYSVRPGARLSTDIAKVERLVGVF